LKETEKRIRAYIKSTVENYRPDPITGLFIDRFREIYGDNLRAVIYYGSKLVEGLSKPSSFRDFFVIVDEYGPMERDWFDRLTFPILPPNMWFLTVEKDGVRQESKYHALTFDEFKKYCSRRAPDHYMIGRMSKRVAILWAKDDSTRAMLMESLGAAFLNNAIRAAPLLDTPLVFEDAVKHFLAMSYRCELRLETPDKIDQIYRTGKEYYDPLYEMLFELFVDDRVLVKDGDRYRAAPAELKKNFRARLYTVKSTVRHVSRSPLMIRNMSNWLEQLLGKYERTYGKSLELTDFERRHKAWTVLKYSFKIFILKRP